LTSKCRNACRSCGRRAVGLRPVVLTALVFLIATAAGAADVTDPRKLVDDTIETLRERVIREETRILRDPGHAIGIMQEIIAPHIDVQLAGRLVLGRHWAGASTAQREAFIDALRHLLLRIFALHVSTYTDAEVSFGPTVYTGRQQQRARVRTEVSRGGSPTVTVDYRLRRNDNAWKVYDVAIFGISIVKTYHLTIDADVRKHGLDGVIDQINAMSPIDRFGPAQ